MEYSAVQYHDVCGLDCATIITAHHRAQFALFGHPKMTDTVALRRYAMLNSAYLDRGAVYWPSLNVKFK